MSAHLPRTGAVEWRGGRAKRFEFPGWHRFDGAPPCNASCHPIPPGQPIFGFTYAVDLERALYWGRWSDWAVVPGLLRFASLQQLVRLSYAQRGLQAGRQPYKFRTLRAPGSIDASDQSLI